eukprot:m.78206 g.78206  ORF g.78206 m.78206 type:complete len:376 (-) comp17341_c0_seq3:231-1358(-)
MCSRMSCCFSNNCRCEGGCSLRGTHTFTRPSPSRVISLSSLRESSLRERILSLALAKKLFNLRLEDSAEDTGLSPAASGYSLQRRIICSDSGFRSLGRSVSIWLRGTVSPVSKHLMVTDSKISSSVGVGLRVLKLLLFCPVLEGSGEIGADSAAWPASLSPSPVAVAATAADVVIAVGVAVAAGKAVAVPASAAALSASATGSARCSVEAVVESPFFFRRRGGATGSGTAAEAALTAGSGTAATVVVVVVGGAEVAAAEVMVLGAGAGLSAGSFEIGAGAVGEVCSGVEGQVGGPSSAVVAVAGLAMTWAIRSSSFSAMLPMGVEWASCCCRADSTPSGWLSPLSASKNSSSSEESDIRWCKNGSGVWKKKNKGP